MIIATFPDRLRYLRSLSYLSQRDLAKLAGLTPTHVATIESSTLPRGPENIAARTVASIATVLGSSIDWLYAGAGRKPRPHQVAKAVARANTAEH